jgi:hypothetical protein
VLSGELLIFSPRLLPTNVLELRVATGLRRFTTTPGVAV